MAQSDNNVLLGIYVKMGVGKIVRLTLDKQSSVSELKEQLLKQSYITSTDNIHLLFRGLHLKDDQTMQVMNPHKDRFCWRIWCPACISGTVLFSFTCILRIFCSCDLTSSCLWAG